MEVSDIKALGVDKHLIEKLYSWGIKTLTKIQALAIEAGVANGQSMIISAPTSSGKTLIGEIAVFSALSQGMRALYLVSHKALADQKYKDFLGRFGETAIRPITAISLNTGDRTEGDIDAQLVIATYEKALGLFVSGQIKVDNTLVVADELQIIGESGRGPDIEALCTAFRQHGIRHFVALTATVENSEDIAGWMECSLVSSSHRDIPLHQEIWFEGNSHEVTFGNDVGRDKGGLPVRLYDINATLNHLLGLGLGPVLVFTETRKETSRLAESFRQNRPRVGDGLSIAEQLDLFSEPTESSEQLKESAERRVAFHSADLSPNERQVIEDAISQSKFDVCFATSTLAAGVNFPFRTIIFSKLTYQYGDRAGTQISRSDYRNMSGRAGRLGMHPEGHVVLLPKNRVELAHANNLVLPDNDRLNSQLVNLSLRKSILTFVASNLVSSFEELLKFFQNTLYWYQTLNRNPEKLNALTQESQVAIDWLSTNGMLEIRDSTLLITPLGRCTALSGLLPSSAVQFATILRNHQKQLASSFDKESASLIYAACASDEFCSEHPSRFLPYPGQARADSMGFWSSKKLLVSFDKNNHRLAQCAHAISLFSTGLAERKIAYASGVTSGNLHRLAIDVAWVLDGMQKLSSVQDIGCPQTLSNQIGLLARQVRWGAPVEVLDVLRIADRHLVPGFGRQRAMALLEQGIATVHDVLSVAKDKLTQLLRSDKRTDALLDAMMKVDGANSSRLSSAHIRFGKQLGIEGLLDICNTKLGAEYESAIISLLGQEGSWNVSAVDSGGRQNVPDILIELGDIQVLVECKTCTKSPALIKKEEAWAILQKAADFSPEMRRVTLGKPGFDETSKKKAAASYDITLVEHEIFIEGMLRVISGSISPKDFLVWLGTPGLAEMQRLTGNPTYNLS